MHTCGETLLSLGLVFTQCSPGDVILVDLIQDQSSKSEGRNGSGMSYAF